MVIPNLSAKGLVQWSFDQSECKKGDLNGVLTNLRAKGYNQWSLWSNVAKGSSQMSFDQSECKLKF